MASLTQQFTQIGAISPPTFVPTTVVYETMMGTIAYGVNTEQSDCDVYGVCIPPKLELFPHLAGEIPGFGAQKKRFEQFQHHHIQARHQRCSSYSGIKPQYLQHRQSIYRFVWSVIPI